MDNAGVSASDLRRKIGLEEYLDNEAEPEV